jgi:hypothetical protein
MENLKTMQETSYHDYETMIQTIAEYGNRRQSDAIGQSNLMREMLVENQQNTICARRENSDIMVRKPNDGFMM